MLDAADTRLNRRVYLHLRECDGPPNSGRYSDFGWTGSPWVVDKDSDHETIADSLSILSSVPPAVPWREWYVPERRRGVRGGNFDARFPPLYPPLAGRSPGLKSLFDFANLRMSGYASLEHDLPVLQACLAAGQRCQQVLPLLHTVDITYTEEYHLVRGRELGCWNYLQFIEPHVQVVRYFFPWGSTGKWGARARRVYFAPLLSSEDEPKWWYVPWDGCGDEVVIHLTGAERYPWRMESPQGSTLGRGRHSITLIFTDVASAKDEGGARVSNEHDVDDKWLSATDYLISSRGGALFTLVDATPALFCVNHPDEIVPRLQESARGRLGEGDSVLGLDRHVASMPDRVEVLTRHEYRRRVGDELYALDMVGIDLSRRRKAVFRPRAQSPESDEDVDYVMTSPPQTPTTPLQSTPSSLSWIEGTPSVGVLEAGDSGLDP
jgi:hypothetical protein